MKAIPTNSHAALQLVTQPERPAQVGSLARRIRTIRVVRLPRPVTASAGNPVDQAARPEAPAEKESGQTPSGRSAGRKRPSARLKTAKVSKKKAPSADRASSGKPGRQPKTPPRARPDSKKAKVLALLERPQGVTLQELTKATGWQPHSVRGFLSGAITKKMRLTVKSEKRDDGERVYSVRD